MTWFPHLTAILMLLGLRSASWWMQCWQLREYRTDRMKAWLQTNDGRKHLWNLWFFRGILPRPKMSLRVLLMEIVFVGISIIFFVLVQNFISFFWATLIWTFTVWFWVFVGVKLSAIPVWWKKRKLFQIAKHILEDAPVIRIGITGSYGKSSTKEILAHLLRQKFGDKNVLVNPGNENNEVAIARLVRSNRSFFAGGKQTKGEDWIAPQVLLKNPPPFSKGDQKAFPRIFICEVGAYKKGEIRQVCKFLRPQIGILTGLNAQHVALFGSMEKIRAAKFELAEAATDTVFFNADTPALVDIFEDQKIHATPVGIKRSAAKDIHAEADKTTFEAFGEKFELPWPGEFFVSNALLSLETARELGCERNELPEFLKSLPPLDRALHVRKLKSGATLLVDLYSANPDGVLGAIRHLEKFEGRKIFVGIPLRELGSAAKKEHEKIFEKLKKIGADVWWPKSDFATLGKELLGKKWHGDDLPALEAAVKTLEKNDAALLESRLPPLVNKIFEQ